MIPVPPNNDPTYKVFIDTLKNNNVKVIHKLTVIQDGYPDIDMLELHRVYAMKMYRTRIQINPTETVSIHVRHTIYSALRLDFDAIEKELFSRG